MPNSPRTVVAKGATTDYPANTSAALRATCSCACKQRANDVKPCKVFQSYPFLDFGWEWSVFRDNETVIKVPAGIFPETSDPRYLENTEYNYSAIGRYIDPAFIAETQFSDVPPNIRQRILLPIPKSVLV